MLGKMDKKLNYNKIVNNAIASILNDKELCQLLYFDNEDPLSNGIEDTSILRGGETKRIYISPYVPLESEKKTVLNVFIDNAYPTNSGHIYEDIYLAIYVLSEVDLWETVEGCRLNSIIQRLDDLFYFSKELDGLGHNLCVRKEFTNFSSKYKGYYLSYKVTDFA